MNIKANYWWGQMHCGPLNQNFAWAMAYLAHPAAPPRYSVATGNDK